MVDGDSLLVMILDGGEAELAGASAVKEASVVTAAAAAAGGSEDDRKEKPLLPTGAVGVEAT